MRKLVSRLQAHTHREDTDRPRLLRSLALISLYSASSCSSSQLLASCSRSASSSRSSVESESTLRKLQPLSPILQLRYVLTRPLSACDLRRRPSVRPVRPHHHRRRRLRRHLQRHMCCTPSPHAALHALNSLVWGSLQKSAPRTEFPTLAGKSGIFVGPSALAPSYHATVVYAAGSHRGAFTVHSRCLGWPAVTAAGEGAAVYLFLVWSCTRTYASLVFLLISISGSVGPRASPLRVCRAARVMRSCSAARVMRFSCRAARTRGRAPSNPSPRIRSPGSLCRSPGTLCRLRSQGMAQDEPQTPPCSRSQKAGK